VKYAVIMLEFGAESTTSSLIDGCIVSDSRYTRTISR
jgi:hypothetical protein